MFVIIWCMTVDEHLFVADTQTTVIAINYHPRRLIERDVAHVERRADIEARYKPDTHTPSIPQPTFSPHHRL